MRRWAQDQRHGGRRLRRHLLLREAALVAFVRTLVSRSHGRGSKRAKRRQPQPHRRLASKVHARNPEEAP